MTKEKVPVYVGNFVVADYGGGMVMAVPAHDTRDFDFAKKYGIKIKEVIKSKNASEKIDLPYTENGILINSGEFNGLLNDEAKAHITKFLELKKLGKKAINYKIRDWMISRQRYWGTPIPIIYCDKCGAVPVKEKDLPVLLPEKVNFNSAGNPIATNKTFLNAKCPKCRGKGKRETDTMGGFVDSSWYFLRYCDSKNKSKPFDIKKVDYWMPVDQYIGGAEHAVMHLMYARFFIKALKDLGIVKFDEPFKKLFNQGIVYKDGAKMSKSSGNVVYQTDISKEYGIDTARLFLMSVSSPDKQMEWNSEGVEGSFKFIKKVFDYFENVKIIKKSNDKIENKLNKTIKQVTEQIENFEYNLAIIGIRTLFDSLPQEIDKRTLEESLKLLHPFCPHITEELWSKLKNKSFISLEKWPEFNEKKINDKFEEQDKLIDNLAGDINNIHRIMNITASNAYIYAIPSELPIIKENAERLHIASGAIIYPYAVNDKNKYDPESKSKKAKPGKPAIFITPAGTKSNL
jgi:leucyl-tRNA synthetase